MPLKCYTAAKLFMAPNAWGHELSPIENIVSRKAEYPYWMSRSDLYRAEIEPISGLHYREVEISHGFYAIIRFERTYFSRFWIFISNSCETQIVVFSEFLRSFLDFSPFLPSTDPVFSIYSPVTSVWDVVLRNQ